MVDVKRDLPRGIGYKSCFMVVEGSTQKKVAEAFFHGRKMKYAYDAGLEKLNKSGSKEKRLMVTGTYKKQNYVIGDEVGSFFYETEEFLEKCKSFSRVYVYMTHRVSETQGFAQVENGELVRLFCYDENEIQNIGEPLLEETELGYRLPANFEEARDEEFTQVNEDVIMELALSQVGIDVAKYPYKDVKLGKRFEYSGELAADPYPDEEREIPEEVWNLPEVQHFMDCTSVEERMQVVEDVKDTLTHPVLDAFGEIVDEVPSYNRLSDRIDEFLCRLRTMKTYGMKSCKETVVSKEEFQEKINNGIRIFEGLVFKHFTIENMKCDTLTFIDCVFLDVKLINNEIDLLEYRECRFIKSEICGKLKKACIVLKETYFNYCRIHDLEINGEQPTEWSSSVFEWCTFRNIKLSLNVTILHCLLYECKGQQIEVILKQLIDNSLSGGKYEDLKIGADIISNVIENVEIGNFEKIAVNNEMTIIENILDNCMINGERFMRSYFLCENMNYYKRC